MAYSFRVKATMVNGDQYNWTFISLQRANEFRDILLDEKLDHVATADTIVDITDSHKIKTRYVMRVDVERIL